MSVYIYIFLSMSHFSSFVKEKTHTHCKSLNKDLFAWIFKRNNNKIKRKPKRSSSSSLSILFYVSVCFLSGQWWLFLFFLIQAIIWSIICFAVRKKKTINGLSITWYQNMKYIWLITFLLMHSDHSKEKKKRKKKNWGLHF